MLNIRSLLVLGLVGSLTAACTETDTDICNTETTCLGEKLTWRMYDEGENYRKGEGVEKDLATAVAWYRKASERGSASAQFRLAESYRTGKGVEKNSAEAVRLY